jgi:Fe-S cluster biogenesis protein NfuA
MAKIDVDATGQKVELVLEQVRPYIKSHGGDVSLVELTPEGVARIQLVGACVGCPMSAMTLKMGIERLLEELVPEVTGVEGVMADDFEWPEPIKE